jgi:hypothetical protein
MPPLSIGTRQSLERGKIEKKSNNIRLLGEPISTLILTKIRNDPTKTIHIIYLLRDMIYR